MIYFTSNIKNATAIEIEGESCLYLFASSMDALRVKDLIALQKLGVAVNFIDAKGHDDVLVELAIWMYEHPDAEVTFLGTDLPVPSRFADRITTKGRKKKGKKKGAEPIVAPEEQNQNTIELLEADCSIQNEPVLEDSSMKATTIAPEERLIEDVDHVIESGTVSKTNQSDPLPDFMKVPESVGDEMELPFDQEVIDNPSEHGFVDDSISELWS